MTTAHFNDGLVVKMVMTGKCLELIKMEAGEKEEVVDSVMIAADTATGEDSTEVVAADIAMIVEEVVLTVVVTVAEGTIAVDMTEMGAPKDVAEVLIATTVDLGLTVVIAGALTVEVLGMVALIETDPLRLVNALDFN